MVVSVASTLVGARNRKYQVQKAELTQAQSKLMSINEIFNTS